MLDEEYIRGKLETLKDHRNTHYNWLLDACRKATPLPPNLRPVLLAPFYDLIQADGFPKPEVVQYVLQYVQD